MQTLLDKIGIIDFKYEKLREQDNFNIFSLLLNKHDEVNLHSRFIADLLNPKGSHRQGRIFLDLFLKLSGTEPAEVQDAKVHTEYKNIDILIKSKTKTVIIENKIWAGDQDKQLSRYHDTLTREGYSNIQIIYLTLDGKEPTDSSLGELKQREQLDGLLTLLSYSSDVRGWLVLCIKEASLIPSLRETIIQYKNLVEELTGNAMSENERKELLSLLSQNDNMLHAKKIADNWVHFRWHTEWDFWVELEKVVAQEYNILSLQKYSVEYLNGTIHRSRNRNPFYGIIFPLKKLDQDELCMYIEKGWDNMYYGVTIVRNGQERTASDSHIYDDLAAKLEVQSDWDREEGWLGGNWLKGPVDFENFSDDITIRLSNTEFRRAYVQKLWIDIKDYIRVCDLENYELPLVQAEL